MSQLKRGGSIKRSPLKKKGPMATLWDDFRGKKLLRERNDEGVIECQDWKIGLPRCGVSVASPDLHHIIGREEAPALYFHHPNLVWLVRTCHDEAHLHPRRPSTKASNDEERQMEATPQRDALLGIQRRPAQSNPGKPGTTIFSSVQNRNAEVLVKKSKGGV
jgi:hypothetical protein